MQTMGSSEFKTCCARTYEDQELQFLLGPSLHPGGLGLTQDLASRMKISSADAVLDIACGLGESARFLARKYGCTILGLDLSRPLIEKASARDFTPGATFLVADGERLPFRDDTFTDAISECSMCLMPDYQRGLREIFRILKPGGRFGIADIETGGPLPSELQEALMRFLCIPRKIPMGESSEMVEAAGFERVEVTDESKSLLDLLEAIKRRLLLAELLTAVKKLSLRREELDTGKRLVALARAAVERHSLRYVMTIAQKPAS